MQTKVLIGLVLVAAIAVMGYAALQQPETAMVETTIVLPTDSMAEEGTTGTAAMNGDSQAEPTQAMPTDAMQEQSGYVVYSPEAFAAATGKKRVLFFHASWCPTCKQANSDFEANASQLPSDVVVFKTDYDTYTDLKRQHGITYQHTFVEVDAEGKQLQKWNGGGVEQVTSKVQ